jgi:outer membrane receptor for ferrienterochelin and colicins
MFFSRFFIALLCLLFACMNATAQDLSRDSPTGNSNTNSELDDYLDIELDGIGITVTGTRTRKRLEDSPIAVEVITADEIAESNADTVVDVLDDYGLVYTGNGMGDYVQMQGMGKNRVLYLVNGRRIAGRIAQRLKGETLPLSNVERIEIVRGPQSALYGSDALGGVINIITKKPPEKLSLDAGLTNRGFFSYDDPSTPQSPGPFDDFNPFREQTLTANLGLPIGKVRNWLDMEASRGGFYYNETKSASILPQYYRGRLGLDSLAVLGSNAELRFGGSALFMRRDDKETARGSLTRFDFFRTDGFADFEFQPFSRGTFTLRLYDNYYQRNKDGYSAIFDRWTTGQNFENENIAALDAFFTYDGLAHYVFTGGVEAAYNSLTKYNLDGGFAGVDKEALFFQVERFNYAIYSLVCGLRLERDSRYGFALAPKLSGMLRFGGNFRAFGGAGLGYRAPDFSDLYLAADDSMASSIVHGNKNLNPEYCLGFNTGLEYSTDGRFAQFNIYYSELFDEIVNVYEGVEDGVSVYHRENLARSLRFGIDSEGRLEFSAIFISAGYSWLFAWDKNVDARIYPQPNHTVKMKVGVNLKNKSIHSYLQARYFSRFLDPSRPESEARFIMDFYISIALDKHFKIHAGIDNISGEMDRIGPETAQSFSVGIKYTL